MKHEGNFEGRAIEPRAARVDVGYDAVVRVEWGTVEAQIMNVSSRGFRLRTRKELEPGTEVALEVARLQPVRAVIRWASGKECGGVFLEAVAL